MQTVSRLEGVYKYVLYGENITVMLNIERRLSKFTIPHKGGVYVSAMPLSVKYSIWLGYVRISRKGGRGSKCFYLLSRRLHEREEGRQHPVRQTLPGQQSLYTRIHPPPRLNESDGSICSWCEIPSLIPKWSLPTNFMWHIHTWGNNTRFGLYHLDFLYLFLAFNTFSSATLQNLQAFSAGRKEGGGGGL